VSRLSLHSIIANGTNVLLDGSAAGNEAILLCDPNDDASWCCDANRVAFDCCAKSDATTFSLPFGTEVAVIKSEPSLDTTFTVPRSTPSSISDGMNIHPNPHESIEAKQ
jgi:hypothetical protein